MSSIITNRLLQAWVPRLSLWRLFVATAVFALVLLALTNPSEAMAWYAWHVLGLVVLYALSKAIAATRSERFFAIGFLVWTGALFLVPKLNLQFEEPLRFVTDGLNKLLYEFIFREEYHPYRGGGFGSFLPIVGLVSFQGFDPILFRSIVFDDVCNPLWMMLFGLIGGWLTASLHRAYNLEHGATTP